MDDFLNEGKLRYDAPRYDEIEAFLNHLHKIAKYNPFVKVTHDMVYSEMEKCTLPSKDFDSPGRPKYVKPIFDKWISRFRNIPNISVFNSDGWEYWCQFVNKSRGDEFIKIYVPINSEGLENGVTELFNFMATHNMHHQSKVGKFLRNDNVVIRLDKGDEKSLKMLLHFINTNPRIKPYLNKPNPFLPCINGIGVMNETGISYNSELCSIITNYIQEHRKDSKISVDDFMKYAKQRMYKKEMLSAFTKATSGQPQYFEAYENIQGTVEKTSLTDIQKQALLNDTIKATYNKYGMHQVVTALMKATTANDYSYFTNGTKGYRDFLRKNVKSEEIKKMISMSIIGIYKKQYTNLRDIIVDYCRYYIEDDMTEKLDEMCEVTIENHGIIFLAGAVDRYCRTGKTDSFSRFKKGDKSGRNYRDNCKFIPPESMLYTIRKSLRQKGVDTTYISNDMLGQIYANALSDSKYSIDFDEDADMKIYR